MSSNFTCPTIDFVFLQDLSGSLSDDLPTLKSQIANVIATVEDIAQNADFAVASFIDKPTSGFGASSDYVYQTNLALSSGNAAVIASVNALTTQSGLDVKEAQLEALYQTLVNDLCTGAVVVLSANSSDFADAVQVVIAKACGHVTQEGTDDKEGTEFEDRMFGLDGDDIPHGHAGDDLVDGGSRDDIVMGGKDADELRGGTGADQLNGGKARDTLNGGLGADILTGGGGRDTFVVNPGGGSDDCPSGWNKGCADPPGGTSVTMQGFTIAELGQDDTILEPFGDAPVAIADTAIVTANNQTLIDVLANDTDVDGDTLSIDSVGSSPNATIKIKGGMISHKADASFSGTDSFTYTITDGNFTHTATVNVTVLPNLIGDTFDNVLVGTQFDDLIKGKGGNDTLTGNDGNDTILGGDGADTINGGLGLDLIRGGNGNDIITDYDIAENRILLDGDVLVQLTDTTAGVLIEQVTGGSILIQDVLAADIRATISGLNEVL